MNQAQDAPLATSVAGPSPATPELTPTQTTGVVEFGEMKIDLDNKKVIIGETPLPLKGIGYRAVGLMAMHRDTLISNQMFVDHLYVNRPTPKLKVVNQVICRVKKIFAAVSNKDFIELVNDKGRRLRNPDA